MAGEQEQQDAASGAGLSSAPEQDGRAKRRFDWKSMLGQQRINHRDTSKEKDASKNGDSKQASDNEEEMCFPKKPAKWALGMLNDSETEEVPGSVLLLSKASEYNEPLGLRNAPARTSASSLPSPYPSSRRGSRGSNQYKRRPSIQEKKRTADGKFVLEPQPDDSENDPLNWKVWRRDAALLSLGFYCMLGGGMTPILAAGFNNVAEEFDVAESRVALTTGLYMMGLGVGSVLLSPTAILYGKRPVYLVAAVCYILTSVWCALSPSFGSLIAARVFQGIAVSSVECLPSASVAEIYFLHEKAYRLGIYTLLLLGGKNLVPLVSAAIIESLGWRWVFWVVAIIVGFGLVLLFLFVPETFWDRTPRPHRPRQRHSLSRTSLQHVWKSLSHPASPTAEKKARFDSIEPAAITDRRPSVRHAHFDDTATPSPEEEKKHHGGNDADFKEDPDTIQTHDFQPASPKAEPIHDEKAAAPDYFNARTIESSTLEAGIMSPLSTHSHDSAAPNNPYTRHYIAAPTKTFLQQLKPYSGRLNHDNWFKVALRPFILYAYPSILWSTLVYSLSIGWLIVLSESVTSIYKSRDTYNFTSLQAGLVYISPFVGGILGTAVAGKVSDLIVRWMARRNGGMYEPEFRLVMAVPIALTTTIGLMGYGWSAQEHDAWIVPTIFFGIISFGCSLGSTTSITFAVDSYRQYAGEALVTLNFSKNVLHGMVFSFFFNNWLESDGSRDVFLAIGGIQLGCMLLTIPMYVYGKRARMWTVRRGMMEAF